MSIPLEPGVTLLLKDKIEECADIAVVNLQSFRLRYDIDQDGIEEDLVVMVDVERDVVIMADYAENVLPRNLL